MDDWIVKLVAPVLAAVAGVYLGFLQGRWSKYKEIVYARKIEIYGDLVTQIFEFTLLCAPNPKLTREQYASVMARFVETQNAFFRASLFMPDALHNDIQVAFTPANDRLSAMYSTLSNLRKIHTGEIKSEQDLDANSLAEFRSNFSVALQDLDNNLPGPFLPFIQAAPRIVKMLKRDLGIASLDSKFYEKAP